MNGSLAYGVPQAAQRDRTHTLFGQTMGYVAVTAGFFALGAYLGRNLSEGWAFVWFIIAFACLIGMNFAVRRSGGLSVVLLLVFGTAASGGAGAAIALLAGVGLFALTAAVATMEQIYRVFVYRSAVGLDTSRGPFSQEDLRQPLTKRR